MTAQRKKIIRFLKSCFFTRVLKTQVNIKCLPQNTPFVWYYRSWSLAPQKNNINRINHGGYFMEYPILAISHILTEIKKDNVKKRKIIHDLDYSIHYHNEVTSFLIMRDRSHLNTMDRDLLSFNYLIIEKLYFFKIMYHYNYHITY